MSEMSSADAWERLTNYAEENARVYSVSQDVPSRISHDTETDTVTLVSESQDAPDEELVLTRSTFESIWDALEEGKTLSRPDVPAYTDLAELLGGRFRASSVMGMLDTVFEPVESDTNPVRVWIPE